MEEFWQARPGSTIYHKVEQVPGRGRPTWAPLHGFQPCPQGWAFVADEQWILRAILIIDGVDQMVHEEEEGY